MYFYLFLTLFNSKNIIKFKLKFKKTLELLIEEGCNVNEQDEIGSTPLHYAAYTNNYEAVLILSILAFEKIKLDVN